MLAPSPIPRSICVPQSWAWATVCLPRRRFRRRTKVRNTPYRSVLMTDVPRLTTIPPASATKRTSSVAALWTSRLPARRNAPPRRSSKKTLSRVHVNLVAAGDHPADLLGSTASSCGGKYGKPPLIVKIRCGGDHKKLFCGVGVFN
ncbi:hypothetical protein H6P81_019889 [Aristolochia fimbriata]|uniref:Ribosomal protein S12 n=1 Tax=Aristolochia fimbriata TaxID=158543 RepID=A0AAV7DTV9_ARIFI|nr:hypothetical protein H6P81_019889 [Aristolochia fimbriata]